VSWEDIFGLTNMVAFVAWAALILLPRWAPLKQAIRFGVIGFLAALYSTLIFVFFFRGSGGFASLAEVKALFASDPVLLAGWVHYLAFDLFVGVWIAERLDGEQVSRLLQAPILMTAFLFGPLGLLLSFGPGLLATRQHRFVRE
jgi:hypothetical protein